LDLNGSIVTGAVDGTAANIADRECTTMVGTHLAHPRMVRLPFTHLNRGDNVGTNARPPWGITKQAASFLTFN